MTRLALLSLLLVPACLADPEADVSIGQGVYGLTISGCDVGDCSDSPYEDARVTATPLAGGAVHTTTSDGGGFFELALPTGSYELCVHNCTTIAIEPARRVRRDFEAGPGGGIWCDDTGCRP